MADRIGSEPLTAEEEVRVRERDADMWPVLARVIEARRADAPSLPDDADYSAYEDRHRLLATLDAARSESVGDDAAHFPDCPHSQPCWCAGRTVKPTSRSEPVALREAYNELANIEDPYFDPKQIAAFEDAIMRSRAVLRAALEGAEK